MDLQKNIASGLQKLRQERNLSQVELAKVLTVSQPTLSLIESGKGSLTAEQFLHLLQRYNLGLEFFLPDSKQDNSESELQNAVARFGAKHLRESASISLSSRYRNAYDLIEMVLSSPISARYITALAPVVLRQIDHIDFNALFIFLERRRLFWFLENIYAAFELRWNDRWKDSFTTSQKQCYSRVKRTLKEQYEILISLYQEQYLELDPQSNWREEVLIRGTTSVRSRDTLKAKRDAIAQKWHILTDLTTGDFYDALVEADENDR